MLKLDTNYGFHVLFLNYQQMEIKELRIYTLTIVWNKCCERVY